MLISRETWRKALRWSSPFPADQDRTKRNPAAARRKFVLSTLIFLLLVLVPGSLCAQESRDTMVLLKGPYEEQGLPFLPRDISPHFWGEYMYRETRITFYYLQRPLSDEAEWQEGDCAFELGILSHPQLGRLHYLPFREGESIVALIPEEADLEICALLDSFQRRFSYFLNTSRQWILPPFPGVVEISSSRSP